MKTKDARKLSPDGQEALRRIAVKAVLAGKTHQEAADMVGVARPTVSKWVKLYKEGGEKALKIRPKGRPKGGSLKGWQAAVIVRIISDKYPDQLKLPWALWTREAVGKLIENKFGIKLSVWAIGKYLRKWGLTPQKPIKRAYERDPVAVERWLHQEYPKIRVRARKEKAEIHWCDEMGVRSDHITGITWGLKGETPVVESTGKRFSCNMISSISNRGALRFKLFEGSFTTDIFIEFMKRLISTSGQKIFLILDNHSVHKAKKVKDWVEEHKEEIALFFLPAYSPELNPDEYLNNDVKSNAVGRRRPKTKEDMKRNISSYLRSTQKQPVIVKSYFRAKSVRYAGAFIGLGVIIRQYFPKNRDFSTITEKEVKMVMDKLNNRPRKCLGMKTPNQVFFGINPPATLTS